jgi:hypothetical protein
LKNRLHPFDLKFLITKYLSMGRKILRSDTMNIRRRAPCKVLKSRTIFKYEYVFSIAFYCVNNANTLLRIAIPCVNNANSLLRIAFPCVNNANTLLRIAFPCVNNANTLLRIAFPYVNNANTLLRIASPCDLTRGLENSSGKLDFNK